MGIVKINRTGTQVPIYHSNALTGQVGTLYPNEMFTWLSEWSGSRAGGFYAQSILFRNSSGTTESGWISATQSEPILAHNICSLPKFTKSINGKTYYGFKMRRTEELYNSSARKLSFSATAGRHILCESSTSGATHPNWLAIRYLETGIGTNQYTEIVPGASAFVDLGYDKGSMFNSDCSLIGSL